jgi:phosphopantothenoylcysteine decarboxylase/phosphopantothenate--cysteine ligase
VGAALAAAAVARGHHVTLVSGPVAFEPPGVDELVPVTSAAEMLEAVACRFDDSDVFIAAAAVADFRPAARADHKIKKGEGRVTLDLEPTADILAEMSRRKTRQILVGFCLESENLEARARAKLQAKGLDLIVANSPGAIAADRQDALLISRDGACERLTRVTKTELAEHVLAAVGAAGT